MAALKKIVIGTRGSRLALVQTELVAKAIMAVHPGIAVENKIITTKGDVNQSPIPLDTVGKAWFTEEIEQAIVRDEVDLAVHSLKDVPPDIPPGLVIVPVLERGDPADVLVSRSGARLRDLPQAAIVGTDSIRRKAQLLALRPDLVVKSIRGNVDTRLKKLQTEDYDAISIAAAGLKRLGLGSAITERFDPAQFVPAPGQAVLAVEVKGDRKDLMEILRGIEHGDTAKAAGIEHAFSKVIGGGCKLPIGCYAAIARGPMGTTRVAISAMVGSMDGLKTVYKSKVGSVEKGEALARELAEEFLKDPITRELSDHGANGFEV